MPHMFAPTEHKARRLPAKPPPPELVAQGHQPAARRPTPSSVACPGRSTLGVQLCSRDPVRAGLQLRGAQPAGPASAPTANTCTTDGRCAAVVAASAEQAELLDATLRRLGLGTAGADLDASPPGWTPASGLPAARPSAGSSASDGGEGRGSGARHSECEAGPLLTPLPAGPVQTIKKKQRTLQGRGSEGRHSKCEALFLTPAGS